MLTAQILWQLSFCRKLCHCQQLSLYLQPGFSGEGSSAFVEEAVFHRFLVNYVSFLPQFLLFFSFCPQFSSLNSYPLALVPTKLACCLQAMLVCLGTLSDPGIYLVCHFEMIFKVSCYFFTFAVTSKMEIKTFNK